MTTPENSLLGKAVPYVDQYDATLLYPIARIASSTNKEAEAFRRFLLSPAGKAIFARYGFSVR